MMSNYVQVLIKKNDEKYEYDLDAHRLHCPTAAHLFRASIGIESRKLSISIYTRDVCLPPAYTTWTWKTSATPSCIKRKRK